MSPLAVPAAPAPTAPEVRSRAGFGPVLALTATLAIAAFLALMSLVLLVVRPKTQGLGVLAAVINQQNQTAKTFLYVAAFAIILPAALIAVPRLLDKIAATPNATGVPLLAATSAGTLAVLLIALRVLGSHGLKALLAALVVWSAAVGAGLARSASPRPWPALLRWPDRVPAAWIAAGVAVLALLVALTARASLHPLPLLLGSVAAAAVLVIAVCARPRAPERHRRGGRAVDGLAIAALVLAIPNLVIFHPAHGLPTIYLPPGVYQNQQDYLLGPVNQLLGGGALLVNVPVSQYGVGLVYFLAAWFHLAPIGYGTLGLLDGILTVLFYVAGYGVLRAAGVSRTLAVGALAVAVVALVYGLRYPIGALPETGPLRFGLPMALVLARVAGVRWPARAGAARAASLCVIAISAIWAFEAFAYTVLVFVAIVAAEAWLSPPERRRPWVTRQVVLALAACFIAHAVLALATLAATGHLPDWGQYFAYLRSFLFGGKAGAISFGFARWSPGLAVAGAVLVSAVALLLLVRRAPVVAVRRPPLFVAIAGTTGYAVGLLSYIDNRSATYLLPYVALPVVLVGTLWLALLWDVAREGAGRRTLRAGALGFALGLAVLLIGAAWPSIGPNLSDSALAHAYPGGGMGAALHRLWHLPPIDPRAPEGERLLRRYVPGRRVIVLLPTLPDLGVEILMRSGRVNALFIGDPVDDSFVFSAWKSRLLGEVSRLRAGQRVLVDVTTFAILARLRADPAIDPSQHPILGGEQETEWLLREIDRRFTLRPLVRTPSGLILAELARR